MKRKIITIGAALVLLVLAYSVGRFTGSRAARKQQSREDLDRCTSLAELDRSFLKNVVTRPSTMTSGTYVLETRFPGKSAEVHVLDLVFSDGRLLTEYLTIGGNLVTNGFTQDETVVSARLHDMHEGPSREYIGLIDGNMVWGRVYVPPGTGWREGEPSAIGVWRLYPEDEGSEETTRQSSPPAITGG